MNFIRFQNRKPNEKEKFLIDNLSLLKMIGQDEVIDTIIKFLSFLFFLITILLIENYIYEKYRNHK